MMELNITPTTFCVARAVRNVHRGMKAFAMGDLTTALKFANRDSDTKAKASILRMMNWLRADMRKRK